MRTQFIIKLIQIGFSIIQNKNNPELPQIVQAMAENLNAEKIDNFFETMDPKQLEALYVFAKSEMEKRYGKSRLDKFV